jgi:uncharacterized DUF497 family protein
MQIIGYNWASLNRHGVTTEMIDEVLLGTMVSYFSADEADETCEMLVGYTFTERLLEVGLRYRSADEVYIFHAQTVSPQYRKLFEEDWQNG